MGIERTMLIIRVPQVLKVNARATRSYSNSYTHVTSSALFHLLRWNESRTEKRDSNSTHKRVHERVFDPYGHVSYTSQGTRNRVGHVSVVRQVRGHYEPVLGIK